MELLKTVASPLWKFFSFFTEEIPHNENSSSEPHHELTAYGRQLFWERRRKEELLREQEQQK